jgi:hypothetical protein
MPAPLVLAPPDKVAALAALRERLREQEAERLRHRDVFGAMDYEPTAKQQIFHNATEFDVLFGGSSGGGKSTALVAHAIRECVRYPGIRVGAFRRSYPELKESLLTELSTTFHFAGALGAKWNGNEYELRFPNGSVVMFRYAETLKDATRRQGGQFQLLIFDERTLTPPDVIAFLESRLRSGREEIPVLGIRSSANPGGAGHGSVKARYITATNFGTETVTDERGRTVRFIASRLADNPHVNPEYAADLQALPEKLRAAFLDGNWDVFSGQMFPELSRDRHVIDPVHLPESWARYCGIDWGYANPWAVLHAALDEDGRVWFYREHYAAGVGEADQARRILASEAEGERISARYADDAMWASRGDARSVADVYSQNGCHLTRAAKGSRVIGWQRVRSYLAEAPACPHHRAMGWETCPKLHMFSTLRNFYRGMTDLPHAESGDPEDADTHGDDHLCLAAGTLVATARGPMPIERVTAADSVWTRKGLRRVTAAGMTACAAATGTVPLSDGTFLRGTANHPVWVAGRGWTTMDALRYSDILEAWPPASASSSTESRSAGTRTPSAGPTRSTSRLASRTASAASAVSIRRSGRRSTGRSRKAITSTTRTMTRSTTTRPTLTASPVTITSRTTLPSATTARRNASRSWTGSGRWRPNGTAAKKAAHGTGTTRTRPSSSARWWNSPASTAGSTSRPGTRRSPASARTTAKRSGARLPGLTTRTGPARPAVAPSRSTSTPVRCAAPVSVLGSFASDSGPHDVYNLTVDGEREFYAGGVLVHNCDAARYLLINLGGGAQSWIDWAKRKAEAAAAGTPDLAAAAHRARLANPGPDLAKCRKPDCDRLVSAGAAYCCVPCTEAAAGRYEIRAHSGGCDERAAERGVPVALAEPEAPLSPAEQLRQARTAAYRAQQGR